MAALLGGAAQPQQEQQQTPTADQSASGAEKSRQQRPPVMITLSEPEGQGGGNQQQAEDDASWPDPSPWYDLVAQSLMALWALLQLVLTGIGIYFLRETLRATREAVEDTGKATEAMLAANVIAKAAADQAKVEHEARERENIPALLAVDATYIETDDRGGDITLTFENVGKQAAIDVYVLSREAGNMPEGEFYQERSMVPYIEQTLVTLGKHQKIRLGAVGAHPRKATIKFSINQGSWLQAVITHGAVVYSDAGGSDYYSQFWFFLPQHEVIRGVVVPMRSGTLRMATFKPYHGPELRDREGY